MGNISIQNSDGNSNQSDQQSSGQQQSGAEQTNTVIAKRTAVRQKLAIALMAVGGVLVAAFIWFALSGNKIGQ